MKKLMELSFIATLLVLALTGYGLQEANAEQPKKQAITLKVADFYPVGHVGYETSKFLIKRLEELSNGRIKGEHFPTEQLGKVMDMPKITQGGIADIAPITASKFSALSLNGVVGLPYYTTAVEGTEIYNRLFKAVPELDKEIENFRLRRISAFTSCQYDVGTVKKPVKAPEDLIGLKLGSTGGLFDQIAAKYGIIPTTIPGAEMFEATQRGIVDGNVLSFTSVKGYRLDDLEKFYTYGLRMGSQGVTYCMNPSKWQKLPADLQKVVLQAGEEAGKYWADHWDELVRNQVDEIEKKGGTLYRIKPEDRAKWEAPLKGIEQMWINEMNQKGLAGQKAFDAFIEICKEVATK